MFFLLRLSHLPQAIPAAVQALLARRAAASQTRSLASHENHEKWLAVQLKEDFRTMKIWNDLESPGSNCSSCTTSSFARAVPFFGAGNRPRLLQLLLSVLPSTPPVSFQKISPYIAIRYA